MNLMLCICIHDSIQSTFNQWFKDLKRFEHEMQLIGWTYYWRRVDISTALLQIVHFNLQRIRSNEYSLVRTGSIDRPCHIQSRIIGIAIGFWSVRKVWSNASEIRWFPFNYVDNYFNCKQVYMYWTMNFIITMCIECKISIASSLF